MATGEFVEPREIVKANNELFRCKYKIKDVVAGRIFMAFASLVDHNDVKENQSFVEYKIKASSIIHDIDAGGGYLKQLEDAAWSLVDHKIKQYKHNNHFALYTLFSKIEYENGIITGQFHKDLIPFFIIAKERFTKLKLTEYMNLPSIYSQCIFGLLQSWYDKYEFTIKTSELHDILDTPPSFRKNFAEFKRRVLDKACKDINEKTSLSYEWEPIKNGRSFSEIKFIFIKKIIKTKETYKRVVINNNSKNNSPRHDSFLKFRRKFKNTSLVQRDAWNIWEILYAKGCTPKPEDVPEDNNLGIIDFLKQWDNKNN